MPQASRSKISWRGRVGIIGLRVVTQQPLLRWYWILKVMITPAAGIEAKIAVVSVVTIFRAESEGSFGATKGTWDWFIARPVFHWLFQSG